MLQVCKTETHLNSNFISICSTFGEKRSLQDISNLGHFQIINIEKDY